MLIFSLKQKYGCRRREILEYSRSLILLFKLMQSSGNKQLQFGAQALCALLGSSQPWAHQPMGWYLWRGSVNRSCCFGEPNISPQNTAKHCALDGDSHPHSQPLEPSGDVQQGFEPCGSEGGETSLGL